ncbi:MAG: polyribonucleotide nucleotidyltransferase [Alphaproteobacteria bacterium]|nr:polyribonucleotide nucleotidyltransferase [Alphaproteobacteria bacterium]
MVFKEEISWGGRVLSIETGKFANQATGSAMVRYGDSIVLCTVVADDKPSAENDFFPLTVNYIEKYYAAGRIPGGFVKREGRPSEREVLISRLIDRPIRPLFHQLFKNETQIICTVLSFDNENDTDIISIIGASAALAISGVPFFGPIAAAKIGYENGEFILNPKIGHETRLNLTIAGTKDGVMMVESGAKELSETEMLSALKFGHQSFQPVIDIINKLTEKAGKAKWPIPDIDENAEDPLLNEISDNFMNDIESAYNGETKHERNVALKAVFANIVSHFAEREEVTEEILSAKFHDICSIFVRNKLLKYGKRIDNRTCADIRPINVEVSVLPKVHGSAVFNRGETQALAIATLGTSQDEQIVDALGGEYKERFLLHYNFPPFSVGEIGRLGSPGRREIGHGKLAWKAIDAVLPSKEEFPYAIRIVSEVLSCNGSSSMATVCGSSLALMDAGVPIKNAVAGIAMGLIIDGENYVILSDIMGEEDHLGDMDFKVAGTKDGITALQMDLKVNGVSFDIMEKAMKQAQEGRMHILAKMSEGLTESRKELSENAPKLTSISIPKDKIRDVIGTGGKVIREIIEKSNTKIDIDDDGNVTVAAQNSNSLKIALDMIKEIAFDPEEGAVYNATVVKIMDFGAFVRFYGTREGLVHVSTMSEERVEKVTDIVNEGDEIKVKFLGYDNKGRAKLTMKI